MLLVGVEVELLRAPEEPVARPHQLGYVRPPEVAGRVPVDVPALPYRLGLKPRGRQPPALPRCPHAANAASSIRFHLVNVHALLLRVAVNLFGPGKPGPRSPSWHAAMK